MEETWTFLRRYSDAMRYTANFAFDVLFLASKVSPQVSERVGQASLIGLNALSLLSLTNSVDLTLKYCRDWRCSQKTKQHRIGALALGNVAQNLADFSMMGIGIAAAVQGYLGNETRQTELYQNSKYVSMATVLTAFAISCLTFWQVKQTNKMLQELTHEETQLRLAQHMTTPGENVPQVSAIRFCMEKDTLKKLLEKLPKISPENLTSWQKVFAVMRKNVLTQRMVTYNSRVTLDTIGLILLLAQKYYTPNSIQTPILNLISLGMSAGWCFQTLREKKQEMDQRDEIDSIETDDIEAIPIPMQEFTLVPSDEDLSIYTPNLEANGTTAA